VFTTADSGHTVSQLNSEHGLLTIRVSGLVRELAHSWRREEKGGVELKGEEKRG
jgi:hypothetical protein